MYVFSSIGYVFPSVIFGGNQQWGRLGGAISGGGGGEPSTYSCGASVEEGERWRDPRDMVRHLQVVTRGLSGSSIRPPPAIG